MEPCFTIETDPVTSTMRIAMSGFYSPADIERFVTARAAELRRLRCRPNDHLTLVDIRGMKIQSQESVEAFAHVLGNPAYASRRLAFVVETSLARQQIQRAAAGRDAGFFQSAAEAEAWLRG